MNETANNQAANNEGTADMDKDLNKIATDTLDLDTLETRKSDGLDFHDMAVWQIKQALEEAYRAGQQSS